MRKTAKPNDVARFLEKSGFTLFRQRGSHAQYRHPDGRKTSVPMHRRELKRGTLHGILKQAGFTLEDF